MSVKPVSGSEWESLPPEQQAVTPILACKGCGRTKSAPAGDDADGWGDPSDVFPAEHCGECPPWRCGGCGEMDSSAKHCGCWTDLTTMAPADIKALFAADGLFNVESDGRLTIGHHHDHDHGAP
jgi:hypothetical protein